MNREFTAFAFLALPVWQPFAYYYDLDAISGLQGVPNIRLSRGSSEGAIAGPQFEAFPEEFCIRSISSRKKSPS